MNLTATPFGNALSARTDFRMSIEKHSQAAAESVAAESAVGHGLQPITPEQRKAACDRAAALASKALDRWKETGDNRYAVMAHEAMSKLTSLLLGGQQ